MFDVDPIALAAQVAMGIGLAACTGLRAFLPPLILGAAARAGLVGLPDSLSWLASTPSLVALGSAVLIELLGDKIPIVDHLLDAAGTILRPAAGALVGAAPLLALAPQPSGDPSGASAVWALGIAGAGIGAGVSGVVLLLKSAVRLASTGVSGALANPILSIGEDVVGTVGSVLAVLVPLVALGLMILAGGLLWRLVAAGRSGPARSRSWALKPGRKPSG
ncbi:MAG TPA: DUF4126 domain-containing protein [Candidatus Polarisedimenticolia bacterium]|nr:DUF4126 domain-containing protein [Candidatus Polarisedimenticolia bacterium]